MYVCGPTVYNYFHIGNARPFLFFDVVRRYFEYKKYIVTYAQNITDVDDKIIKKANDENVDYKQITQKYIKAFKEDCKRLGIKKPDYQPKATDYIEKMINFISDLIEKKHAYENNGDVYFAVESIDDYGSLSGRKLSDMKIGARIKKNENKKNPADFTLWKKAKKDEPSWDSPWGKGRPGWHTECVVMSLDLLGSGFDIHAGGNDLIFPHHENEIAQAKAQTGKNMAKFWMHNGFINVEGEKMSKSLNNFFLTRDVLKNYSAETIRFFFLSKHYRSPIDFNEKLIKEAETAITGLYNSISSIPDLELSSIPNTFEENEEEISFSNAMDDDFNTAHALSVIFNLNKQVKNEKLKMKTRRQKARLLIKLGKVLGFFDNIQLKLGQNNDLQDDLIELLINYRTNFKQEKNWEMADKIRADLRGLGVELRDAPEKTTWKINKKY